MQYGFVIDHERCIGCHACTVACKSENDVPVGDFRTWVKYTERGSYPEVKRHFSVLRCNHCTDAPCVTICPVNALEKRPDGIVDVDRDACIGCRACMQACPYDALYLNEDKGAVEKCHFCAHRVEQGLEPACVVVCPENAIIPGDLNDPESRAGRLIRERETLVRRPEQGTGPNVHYIGADEVALDPGAAARPKMYMSSDRPPHKPEAWPISLPVIEDARTVLDTGHRVEWGWPVALYLLTKGVAAGVAFFAPFTALFGLEDAVARYAPEIVALVFLAITMFLLIEDLAKPQYFYRLLTRPNWNSWLVKGGVVLGVFGAGVSASILTRALGMDPLADALRWINAVVALGVAGYTAFLFAQCKGRDLWESRWLLPHLLVQALYLGAGTFLAFGTRDKTLMTLFALGLIAHAIVMVMERHGEHETSNARQAAAFLGQLTIFNMPAFLAAIVLGVALPLIILLIMPPLAIVPAVFGLYCYEHAFVRAGQLPPLS